MKDFLIALFLGFVEGLTEFIPVSSTAHLVILTDGLNFPAPPGHVFEVFIQLGAILAVVVLYREKLWRTATGLPHDRTAQHFAVMVAVATIPALVAGALGRDWIKGTLYNPGVIGSALIIGGIIILLLDRKFVNPRFNSVDDVPVKTAFMVGCCQALALVPGVSRSGATIIGGLVCGLSRPAAAELSFFLAIPVMFAAVAFDLLRGWEGIAAYGRYDLMMAGFFAAFATALAVVKIALRVISRYGFAPFAWYRIFAGSVVLLFFM